MRIMPVLALLALAGCATAPDHTANAGGASEKVSTVASTATSTVTPVQPKTDNCREFTVPIKVGNEEKEAHGRACEQADGSWQIVQPNGAQPPTVIEHTNIYPAYPYWGPPWWGPPWGFGAVGFRHRHW